MRIEGIAATFPSRVVSNDDILEMIATESGESFRGDPQGARVLQRIRQLRAARKNLVESRNEKAKHKEPAVKAINDALATLEGILARD